MYILTATQMRRADQFTMENEPINSIDLMERAASKCFDWFCVNFDKHQFIHLFCGPGNNGGDGLALARMLYGAGYQIKATLLQLDSNLSADCRCNLERLKNIDNHVVDVVINNHQFPEIKPDAIIVDAIFGTGLTRNIDGVIGRFVERINGSGNEIISIDLPSGINSDNTSLNPENNIIKAYKTLTFQFLKPGLLVGENSTYFGQVHVLNIGLLLPPGFEKEVNSYLVDQSLIEQIYVPKWEFSHKGNFGHGLLITGEKGKMGAAILCAGGFLRSGGGLLSLLVPEEGISIVQSAVPEAMVIVKDDHSADEYIASMDQFNVVGIGPGIGKGDSATMHVKTLIESFKKPIILDADALNILSSHPEWLSSLPPNSILTPHPGEFKRLVGGWKTDFEKLEKQRDFAQKHQVFLILKGKNSSIASPNGKMYFNPTGNSGMAKGGSGDVLTGLLTGILASGYSQLNTCLLGTYIHGLAGDLAAAKLTKEAMKAGDLIDFLPDAWKKITS